MVFCFLIIIIFVGSVFLCVFVELIIKFIIFEVFVLLFRSKMVIIEDMEIVCKYMLFV